MKILRFMLVLFAALAAARGDDLRLADGRILKAAQIVSESPLRVTIRHEGGLSQIDKMALPSDLRAKYPANVAAHEEAERVLKERQAAADARRAEQAKVIEGKLATEIAAREAEAAREKKELALATKNARETAQRGADQYFRTKWRPGNNEVRINDCVILISAVSQKSDYSGKWRFSGEAWMKYYVASGRGYLDSKQVPFEGEVGRDGEISITEKL